jgi:ABC-type transport system involved in multi-copper enzyme maturation permease subunit
MLNDFSFLKSRRFYAIVIIAIIGALKTAGVISDEIANAIITILTGFTVIRTVDKFIELE